MANNRHRHNSQKPTSNKNPTPPKSPESVKSEIVQIEDKSSLVLPEQMSLTAHEHIQNYLKLSKKQNLDKNDLNAILKLSQHLRVFGLLSAVGYLNQSNAQRGEIRERVVPVWESLIGQMIDKDNPLEKPDLMKKIVDITKNKPEQYMWLWRTSLLLANHWNFWARAYQED